MSSIKRHIGYNPNQPSATGRYHFGLWSVSTEALNQLITGEVRFFKELKPLTKEGSDEVSILYQSVENVKNKTKIEYYIHTIFINEEILK